MCLRHRDDLAHERVALQLAVLHLRELEFPLRRELRGEELGHAQAVQQRHQRECLGGRNELAALAVDVPLGDQAFDDLRARGRRAEALLAHRFAKLLVVDQLAGAFHGRQQRRFGEARRRTRGIGDRFDLFGRDVLAGLDRDERRPFARLRRAIVQLSFLAVDREPARDDQHLAFGLERLVGDAGDPRGHQKLGGRIERREKALDDEIVELRLELVQVLRRHERRDDREVVGDLRVVEDPLVRPDPLLLQHLAGERRRRHSTPSGPPSSP